jgi:hypothetical protein
VVRVGGLHGVGIRLCRFSYEQVSDIDEGVRKLYLVDPDQVVDEPTLMQRADDVWL